jgi:iron complex transport system ATP-binding protein
MLTETFGLDADVLPDPRTGLPIIVPTSSAAQVEGTPAPADRELAHAPQR